MGQHLSTALPCCVGARNPGESFQPKCSCQAFQAYGSCRHLPPSLGGNCPVPAATAAEPEDPKREV
eukprot:CAMPEP_0115149372 /NCGR_PEP_ID=MMETSP0227-20121206/64401_1 /TAXON_ID=89957 /ORGANISM="Polarella glacialis, Strain CCMP 1383" /LENGTH=65 /DNA_ID=CAMNT_0002559527 /DNA_START=37 /DNA_END=230 /DNA_ORIENTATION=-